MLDATGVDRSQLADRLGFPARFGRSRFAITRGDAFEARLRADGARELLAVTGLEGAEVVDLELVIDIAGRRVTLEPDPVLVRAGGRLHVVAIKSFAVVDGQADGEKLAAAGLQAAVHVLALRQLGHDPAHDVLLVCPENFSNRPVANRLDVRRQLRTLERQLSRLPEAGQRRPAEQGGPAEELVTGTPARYAPECLAACELALFCRDEARRQGLTDALGRSIRDSLGGIATIREVLTLASGACPSAEHVEVAELLLAARALRAETGG
jgi:hypothetical protein